MARDEEEPPRAGTPEATEPEVEEPLASGEDTGGADEEEDLFDEDEEEPLGPGDLVEERDFTGGPATSFAERSADVPYHQPEGPGDTVLEGPEAGPVLTVGPAIPARRGGSRVAGSRWLDPLAPTLQQTRLWLREIALQLGEDDPRLAWQAARAVLGALRDQLTIAEVADLAAQLPLPIRGIWFEGWTGHPSRVSTAEAFRSLVARALGTVELDPDKAIRAVCGVLKLHVSADELGDVRGVLPGELKELVGVE